MPFSASDAVAIDRLGIDVMDLHLAARVDSGVNERFRERLVRFGEIDVLADHRDVHLVLGMHERVDEPVPH